MSEFNSAFCEGLDGLPGIGSPQELLNALNGESAVSIRFNPFKVSARPEGDQVPWCRYGFYLDQRPRFTLDPLFHAGAYYVQEASSMFIEAIYRSLFADEQSGLRILDLCASPGGKTTLLSTLAGGSNLVVANEVIRQRSVTLADNVKKWGVGNVVVTNNDPSHFVGFEDWFDMILVDAPCSGEGMFGKNEQARNQWSEANVKLCAARSRRILSDTWGSLKPGGVMVMSTCTFNTEENEETVRWLAEEFGAQGVGMTVEQAWGVEQGSVEGIDTFRFYPHKLRGEGFFAAVMRKIDDRAFTKAPKPRKAIFTDLSTSDKETVGSWFTQPEYMRFAAVGDSVYGYYADAYRDIKAISESMTVIHSGVVAGQLFHGKLKPDHSLAMSHHLNRESAPVAELELEQALNYLRKADVDSGLFIEGINLVSFEGMALGWAKRVGARVNNLYPKELRIVNL